MKLAFKLSGRQKALTTGRAEVYRVKPLVVALLFLCTSVAAHAGDVAVLKNGFSIRHERREVVGTVTRLYLSRTDKAGYIDVPTAAIEHFDHEPDAVSIPTGKQALPDLVREASGRYHLDPDLVNSVIRAESGFNVRAVSHSGAQGLMQLMPQTASGLGVADTFDASSNVDGGARYLRQLLEKYDFDLIKALAAYNAGPGRVEQYRGVPPFYETRAYVTRVVTDFNKKKLAQQRAALKKSKTKNQIAQQAPARTTS